ncbi:MAG: glutamate--tRNA ligase [Microgenomates group bacterium]|nr:glutamate--tRNA ligase [Microgenomates group bacterium]
MVRTRIAPSPTGEDLHIGNLYTALINWAWVRKNKGKFVVRIEDTDRQRLVKGAEERILKTLKDFGLEPDEDPNKGGPFGPYRQSERLRLYQEYAHQLVEKGFAYYCTCSKERLDEVRKKQIAQKQIPRYDRHCRNLNLKKSDLKTGQYVVRLKVPVNSKIIVDDLLRGKVEFDSNNIDDQVLLKSDGYPTYHLAVVIDDYLMKISHVIRAEEWLSSTPKHILLYEAFGWEKPIFCHLPILRNPDRSKLSKRKNPVWASWYLSQGYLPEAVLNYLALMGWSHPQEKEIFSLDEFIEVFDLKDIHIVGPAFDPVKLEWMNGEYIRQSQNSNLKSQILNYFKEHHNKDLPEDLVEKTIPLIKERIKQLADYWDYCQFFYKRPENYEVDLKDKKPLLKKIYEKLEKLEEFTAKKIGEAMMELVKEENLKTGRFFQDLRVAITGKKISPPLNESMEILGKSECLERIKKLI